MQKFLVGGAVRDELLGLPVTDRDWVVVGSHPQEMLDAGYKSVGKDFPVFLHPESHEEYALARVERKTGSGYQGFEFTADKTVTLEEDLSRRDLTINAMAKRENGDLVDPFNGMADVNNRVLRHVSHAFVEDPVRVLRVARFMARFSHLNFTVAEDTQQLMKSMVDNREVDHLVAERVWQEMKSALTTPSPSAFFDTLKKCNALSRILPEVDALSGVPQPRKWHPEVDSYVHTMMTMHQAAILSKDPDVRFAALCHDLGKAETPTDLLPSHHGHEKRGASLTQSLCKRLRIPKRTTELAVLTARFHTHTHKVSELTASTLNKLLQQLDVVRKPDRFKQFLLVCEADAKGRLGMEDNAYPQADMLIAASEVFCSVDSAKIAKNTKNKSAIAAEITAARVRSLKLWLKTDPFKKQADM